MNEVDAVTPESVDPRRVRWQTGLIVVGVAAWAAVMLALALSITPGPLQWVEVAVVLAMAVAGGGCFARAVRSPTLAGTDRYPQGLGADGPERRRVRRALRDGLPLRPADRERALLRARLQASGQTVRVWWVQLGSALMLTTTLVPKPPDSSPYPKLGTGLMAAGVLVVWIGVLAALRPQTSRRAAAMVLRLENHPVITSEGAADLHRSTVGLSDSR